MESMSHGGATGPHHLHDATPPAPVCAMGIVRLRAAGPSLHRLRQPPGANRRASLSVRTCRYIGAQRKGQANRPSRARYAFDSSGGEVAKSHNAAWRACGCTRTLVFHQFGSSSKREQTDAVLFRTTRRRQADGRGQAASCHLRSGGTGRGDGRRGESKGEPRTTESLGGAILRWRGVGGSGGKGEQYLAGSGGLRARARGVCA